MPRQPYHLVDYSPWPLTGSIGALFMTISLTAWFHSYCSTAPIIISLLIILSTMYQWWRDVIRESTFLGCHTSIVMTGLQLGMILFITSEVLFFFAFFWAYFHSSITPTFEMGCLWPPSGTSSINPFSVPLLNTVVLLTSGITVTWAHHSLLNGDNKSAIYSLSMTVMLGVYFTILQGVEYMDAPFSISDSIYGSSFFVATGFHGLHVIIGSIFLTVSLWRKILIHFSNTHHLGFEAAAWYWHFVDVVWIFLYISIYWWGYL